MPEQQTNLFLMMLKYIQIRIDSTCLRHIVHYTWCDMIDIIFNVMTQQEHGKSIEKQDLILLYYLYCCNICIIYNVCSNTQLHRNMNPILDFEDVQGLIYCLQSSIFV